MQRPRWLKELLKNWSAQPRVWAGGGILALAVIALLGGVARPLRPESAATPYPSGFGLAVDVTLKLGLVLMLIYACVYALRKWDHRARSGLNQRMSVLESVHLTARQSLHLVRAGDRVLLIGATDQGLTNLAEVDLPEGFSPAEAPPPNLFSNFLEHRLKNGS